MKKHYLWLLGIILLSAVALRVISWQASKAEALIGDRKISVEIRRTPMEWASGLSNRKNLAEDSGMLFIFPDAEVRRFWMKDMKFSIDIFWIRDGRVIGMAKGLPPPAESAGIIPDATSPEPVNFVLETNAGFADRYNVTLGASFAIVR
ncbi:MAG: DUF192 domain-containing protein [Patescibacteria group bacterium]